jgi:hypothetical protein
MQTVNGLPAHVLLVHAIVVLLPLAAVLLALTALWPAARRRLAGPNLVLSLAVVVLVPITTSAGEWLEHKLTPNPLIHKHTELGDTAIYAAIGVAVLALLVWWRQRESTGRSPLKRTLLAPTSGGIGDSGAKASWSDWASQP